MRERGEVPQPVHEGKMSAPTLFSLILMSLNGDILDIVKTPKSKKPWSGGNVEC